VGTRDEAVGEGCGGRGRAATARGWRTRVTRRARVRARRSRSMATTADRRARTHSAGRLRRLTGGPGCTVSGLNKF
jgi:hypothetical protein